MEHQRIKKIEYVNQSQLNMETTIPERLCSKEENKKLQDEKSVYPLSTCQKYLCSGQRCWHARKTMRNVKKKIKRYKMKSLILFTVNLTCCKDASMPERP